ncbi:hypothetical protein PybrP1_012647, partial [[Pythium] brassicae (nom. inval.)]
GWGSAVVCCVAHSVLVLHAATLATVKILPALQSASHQTLAWNPQSKLLVSTSSVPRHKQELSLYALDFASIGANNVAGVAGSDSSGAGVSESGTVSPKSKSRTLVPSSSSTTVNAATSASAISRLLATPRVEELSEVHVAQFFANGKLLLLSDLKHRAAVFELAPSLACRQVLEFDSRVCHVASCLQENALAVALRGRTQLLLYSPPPCFTSSFTPNTSYSTSTSANGARLELEELPFRFPVMCSAFDDRGFYLAVAEASCLKAWISVIRVHAHQPRLPSKKRFEAHVGKVSGLQWTSASSPLLLSSGFDGYVRVWDIETTVCMLAIHLDYCGVHSFVLLGGGNSGCSTSDLETTAPLTNSTGTSSEPNADVLGDPVLLVLGYTDCRLQSRAVTQLLEFEASRRIEMDAHAATIQKRWKGVLTREFIRKFIRAK